MNYKRGLSAIVTSVIMIVLVMIAIGVVWSIVSNVAEEGSEKISLSSDCLDVNIKATKVVCDDAGICNVTITRNAGGKDIGGVKLIFSDAVGEDTYVEDVFENIAILGTKTIREIDTGLATPNKMEIAVYFIDESENEQLCSQTKVFEF